MLHAAVTREANATAVAITWQRRTESAQKQITALQQQVADLMAKSKAKADPVKVKTGPVKATPDKKAP